MPIKSFLCPKCGETFSKLMPRAEYDATHSAVCPECGKWAKETLSVPASRNPAHGIQ